MELVLEYTRTHSAALCAGHVICQRLTSLLSMVPWTETLDPFLVLGVTVTVFWKHPEFSSGEVRNCCHQNQLALGSPIHEDIHFWKKLSQTFPTNSVRTREDHWLLGGGALRRSFSSGVVLSPTPPVSLLCCTTTITISWALTRDGRSVELAAYLQLFGACFGQ